MGLLYVLAQFVCGEKWIVDVWVQFVAVMDVDDVSSRLRDLLYWMIGMIVTDIPLFSRIQWLDWSYE